MKFILDNQLPRSLVHVFQVHGVQCEHVRSLNLAQATDREIWLFAAEDEWIVVSQDQDFADLAARSSVGPQLVWVRTGNQLVREVHEHFAKALPEIIERLAAGTRVVELW